MLGFHYHEYATGLWGKEFEKLCSRCHPELKPKRTIWDIEEMKQKQRIEKVKRKRGW